MNFDIRLFSPMLESIPAVLPRAYHSITNKVKIYFVAQTSYENISREESKRYTCIEKRSNKNRVHKITSNLLPYSQAHRRTYGRCYRPFSISFCRNARARRISNTVFPVISAPGAFEIEMKHCRFKPTINTLYSLKSK